MRSKRNLSAHEFDLEALSRYFHLPINDVAKELGVCATVLKKICRRNGIERWPHRKIKSVDNLILSLQSVQPTTDADAKAIAEEIESLQRKREFLLENPNASYKTVVPKHTILRVQKATGTGPTSSKLDISKAHKRGRKPKRSTSPVKRFTTTPTSTTSTIMTSPFNNNNNHHQEKYENVLFNNVVQQQHQHVVPSFPCSIQTNTNSPSFVDHQKLKLPKSEVYKSASTSSGRSILLGSQDEIAVLALLNISHVINNEKRNNNNNNNNNCQNLSSVNKSFAQHNNSAFTSLNSHVHTQQQQQQQQQPINNRPSAFTFVNKPVLPQHCSSSVINQYSNTKRITPHSHHTVFKPEEQTVPSF